MSNKWKPVSAEKFHKLYIDRLCEDNPYDSLDEVYSIASSRYNEVSITFGSSGYEMSPRHFLNQTANSIFMHGYCVIFAHCFNELHGEGKYLVLSSRDPVFSEWEGHVMAVLSDGNFFDVRGVSSKEEVLVDYPSDKFEFEIVEEDALWQRDILSKNSYAHPSEFLDELEQAYTCKVVSESVLTSEV